MKNLFLTLLIIACSSCKTERGNGTSAEDLSIGLSGEVWNITSATSDGKDETKTFPVQRMLFSADKSVILTLYPTTSTSGVWITNTGLLSIYNIVGASTTFDFTSVSKYGDGLTCGITLTQRTGSTTIFKSYQLRYTKQ